MVALCVSGVIIHRKIFADFFTLRRSRQPQRLLLDLHNGAGTLGFLFHIVMAFTGLTILASVYFPSGVWVAFDGGRSGYVRETYDVFSPPAPRPAGPAARLARRDGRNGPQGVGRAQSRGWCACSTTATPTAYVEVRPSIEARGRDAHRPVLLRCRDRRRAPPHARSGPRRRFQQYLTGLHFVQFRHWTLRWLFFGLGLLGCLLIVTGFLFWVESRRKAHEAAGKVASLRLRRGTRRRQHGGLVLATMAFFVANRLLPSGATWLGAARYELEIWVFFAVWVLSLRPRLDATRHRRLDRAVLGGCRPCAAGGHPECADDRRSYPARHRGRQAGGRRHGPRAAGRAATAAVTAWRLQRRRHPTASRTSRPSSSSGEPMP